VGPNGGCFCVFRAFKKKRRGREQRQQQRPGGRRELQQQQQQQQQQQFGQFLSKFCVPSGLHLESFLIWCK